LLAVGGCIQQRSEIPEWQEVVTDRSAWQNAQVNPILIRDEV